MGRMDPAYLLAVDRAPLALSYASDLSRWLPRGGARLLRSGA